MKIRDVLMIEGLLNALDSGRSPTDRQTDRCGTFAGP
jgi:hypothetical protein